jgi:hypothetical protein
MKRILSIVIVLATFRVSLGVLAAQSTPPGGDAGSASPPSAGSAESAGSADTSASSTLYTVPDIPALTAIDATGNKIDRPVSASGLAASLSNVIDSAGAVRSGVGIEVSPHGLGVDQTWTYYQYRHDWWRRTLAQSAMSFGTSKTSATPTSMGTDMKAAIGVRVVLWDQSDPLLEASYPRCVAFAEDTCRDRAADAPEVQAQCKKAAYDSCGLWVTVPWNAGGVFVAGAQTWDFADGNLKSLKAETTSAWAAASVPLLSWGQLTGGLAWEQGWHATADKLSVAVRARAGGTKYRFTADGTWFAVREMATAWASWAAGGEIQLSNGAWLTISAGTDLGGPTDEHVSLLSSIKWGYSPQRPQH